MTTKLLSLAICLAIPSLSFANPATRKEEKAIRSLIEDLVFTEEKAKASGTTLIRPENDSKNDKECQRQFEKCQQAFVKLSDFKAKAFPFLVEHLEDNRPSIHFRNHSSGHSVGNACYWVIYFQLQDRPRNYSSYGYRRTGRDGKKHPKPYWTGNPFYEAGGVAKWLKVNKDLSYPEMQIKCLQWLLEQEKKIGAPDAEGYFVNILPLEIRVLERKAETGANVTAELKRLRTVLKNKDVTAVPIGLLSDKPSKAK